MEKNLAADDDLTLPFRQAITGCCGGFGGGDEKTRSMMNLAMTGVPGKMHEREIHRRRALNNGVSKEEIRAIIHVVAIYYGVRQRLE